MQVEQRDILFPLFTRNHYHYIVRTKTGEDIHLQDKSLWNENDYVSVIIPKESIELSLNAGGTGHMRYRFRVNICVFLMQYS